MPSNLKLIDNNGCFVCGKNNPIGLKLEFAPEGDEYVTYFVPGNEHQGWKGIAHGGIVSALMDEVMARALHAAGYRAVTGEMTVRYRKPTLVGKKARFAGKYVSEEGRVIQMSARATDEEGNLLAEATAKFVKV
jgi:uncharacterized protein (TIGR00369 family)